MKPSTKAFFKPTLLKLLLAAVLFILMPTYRETVCKDYADRPGKCWEYYISLPMYLEARGIGWTWRHLEGDLLERIVQGGIPSLILSYTGACAIASAIQWVGASRRTRS